MELKDLESLAVARELAIEKIREAVSKAMRCCGADRGKRLTVEAWAEHSEELAEVTLEIGKVEFQAQGKSSREAREYFTTTRAKLLGRKSTLENRLRTLNGLMEKITEPGDGV